MKEIDELLEKYFEGETSSHEEKKLHDFFSSKSVPDKYQKYKPLFHYLEEEINMLESNSNKKPKRNFNIKYWITGIAASVLLFVGISRFPVNSSPCDMSENYVIINGRCYTDSKTIKKVAFKALDDIRNSITEFSPFDEITVKEEDVLKYQFDELKNIFQ